MRTYAPSYSGSSRSLWKTVDWTLVGIWLALLLFGWINIYASVHTEDFSSIFDFSCRAGKQFIWIVSALVVALLILFAVPPRWYEPIAPFLYAFTIVLLIAVIFMSHDVKGSHSWFSIGPVSFQPAELSKTATSLLLASWMGRGGFHLRGRDLWITLAILAVPMLIIIMEKETGSALVYVGFIFMLYREGLSGWTVGLLGLAILLFILTLVSSSFVGILVAFGVVTLLDFALDHKLKWWIMIFMPLIAGLCFVPGHIHTLVICCICGAYALYSLWRGLRGARQTFRMGTLVVLVSSIILVLSTRFIFDNVLREHQKGRIEVLLGMKEGYNVQQSMIAIGSGGFWGKGFCKGTQTAYGFVPEQSTDFIFCTVGEEWGFAGCVLMIFLYVLMLYRIIRDSERSREAFTRIYGYCVASCLFVHVMVNIGMTLGVMPVIGIPLPFMSYGGSSLWGFTIMLFIFIALQRNERKYF